MTFSLIGKVSLNTSFFLYLIVYIPQLLHNKKSKNLAELSLGLHFLLYFSYFLDLLYGFSSNLPWQYKTVSIIGLSLVWVQHLQLMRFKTLPPPHLCSSPKPSFPPQRNLGISLNSLGIILILTIMFLIYFFFKWQGQLALPYVMLLGTMARVSGLLYAVPQIIKNRLSRTSHAMSIYFIYINLTITILDTISAWSLDWGWPNKLASPLSMIFMLILLRQSKAA